MYNAYLTYLPSGKWSLCGSLSEDLTEAATNHLGQSYRKAPVFETLNKAKKFAQAKGYQVEANGKMVRV